MPGISSAALLAAGLPATGGTSGFSTAIAGTGPVFLAFLAIHVPAGFTAVISGVLAATAPKRHGRHTRAGTVYYRAIAVVSATAAAMAAIRPAQDWYLALLGALACPGRRRARLPAAPRPAALAPLARAHPAHPGHGRLLRRPAHRVLRRQRQEDTAPRPAPRRLLGTPGPHRHAGHRQVRRPPPEPSASIARPGPRTR